MSYFFTADTHYGHKRQVERRGFALAQEHDHMLITRWNEVVGPKDEVYHLGDFSFHNGARTKEIVAQLNGKIFLVGGNHDSRQTLKVLVECGVEILPLIYRRHFPGTQQKVVMCHYPMLTWPSAHWGAIHLHGHSHGNLGAERTTRTDVGVDTKWGYGPVSWEAIEKEMSGREYTPVDHHRSTYEP